MASNRFHPGELVVSLTDRESYMPLVMIVRDQKAFKVAVEYYPGDGCYQSWCPSWGLRPATQEEADETLSREAWRSVALLLRSRLEGTPHTPDHDAEANGKDKSHEEA